MPKNVHAVSNIDISKSSYPVRKDSELQEVNNIYHISPYIFCTSQ